MRLPLESEDVSRWLIILPQARQTTLAEVQDIGGSSYTVVDRSPCSWPGADTLDSN